MDESNSPPPRLDGYWHTSDIGIDAKYSGACVVCGVDFAVEDRIASTPGDEGWAHDYCV